MRRLRLERAQRKEPQLLPVRITQVIALPHCCGLVLGDVRLEFDEGIAPDYVAAVARTLRSC